LQTGFVVIALFHLMHIFIRQLSLEYNFAVKTNVFFYFDAEMTLFEALIPHMGNCQVLVG
jgi:hypothetical protein